MSSLDTDEQHLSRALELARAGIGLASPNPYVGAVIVDQSGNVVGEGIYTYAGMKHAEILALEAAGERARGGTLYINLEPHAHQGRTPPCTDALIAAGIRRVVASMSDPNPKVSGRGFEQLRAAGVQVEAGKLQEDAKKLNEAFARYIRSGLPFVTVKSAMSMDGKIAPAVRQDAARGEASETGFRGTWLTGEAARTHVQELRHQHDAIVVGIGTVLTDDPLLTFRGALPRRRPLRRVVLDSKLRLPLNARIVQSAAKGKENDVLVLCANSGDAQYDQKRTRLKQLGVGVETVSVGANGRLDLQAVLRRLAKFEITSVMVEGGSSMYGAALAAGIVDKMFLYYAPMFLGGRAVPFSRGLEFSSTSLSNIKLHRFGDDFAIEGYLRDPYTD